MKKFFQDIHEHEKEEALLELVDATCTSVTKVRIYELRQVRTLFHKIQLCIAAKADDMEIRERALIEVHGALHFPEGIKHNQNMQCPEWHLNCCLTTSSMKKATYVLKMLE